MLVQLVTPKRPHWMRRSAAVAVASIAVYAALSYLRPWAPGRAGGLTFGTAAALLFFHDAAYPLRRRWLSWPLGTAQRWIQLHVYGGTLAMLFVLIHTGFRLPGGQFGWWLLILSFWATASGLGGVWLQKWIPRVVTASLSVEAIYERIPELAARLRADADALVVDKSEKLMGFYQREVQPALAAVSPSWSYVVDVRAGRERRLAPFRTVAPFLTAEERGSLADLEAILAEKLELDAHYSLQRVLRWWLMVHVPPAMLLTGLLVIHIVSVWWF